MAFFRDNSPEAVEIGSKMLRFLALALPFLAYSSYVNMTYQCLGFVKGASFLAACRQGIFFVPLIVLLSLIWGLDGIIAVQALADLLTCLISIPFHIWFFKNKLS